ncbi:D-alanyl-D-alanine carboxypeptidase [Microbacterium sp. cf046]|uniref:serine hydrolase domain-containing protein n=1 Tax=Microbacterium sp. cf046 TaxID=1761803 RepID=UPI0008EEBD7A|nr:serine hydrolase domain-containing protein [Microbacterium sp. cf046]SFS07480.1 D-alanyl-D-alanine carboxypeptidase [Microbacterium sp. cf046]
MGSTSSTRAAGWAALTVAVVVGVTGCTFGPPSPASTDAAAVHEPVPGSAAACVPDPDAVAAAEDTQSTDPVPVELAAEFDAAAAAVHERVREVVPGVVVGVRSPAGTWSAGYGADLVTGAPVAVDAHARVASVTKSFVGTVILQLAEEGSLSLDDPIDDYVADVPNGTRITLRELISMTSGLGNYSDDEAWGLAVLADPEAEWTPEQLLAYSWSMPTSFAPGSNMQYTNANFILLGLVIEQVTGQALPDVLDERILGPLGLTETSYPTDNELAEPRMIGYTLPAVVHPIGGTSNKWVDATEWSPSSAGAAGAMISDVDDMLAWGRVLATGQGVLSEAAQVARLESFGSSDLAPQEFYGDAIVCQGGWIGHSGNIPGYNTLVRYEPASETTIVVIATGLSGSSTPPREFVTEAFAAALAEAGGTTFVAPVVPDEAQFQAIVPEL